MDSAVTINKKLILFDGVCNLCNGSVQFIIDRDSKFNFIFAALQHPESQKLVSQLKYIGQLDSVVLIENNKIYTKSTAALKIAYHLDGLWPLMTIFYIIPRFLRDIIYQWIAKNRYKWFGKTEFCRVMTPELKNRFWV